MKSALSFFRQVTLMMAFSFLMFELNAQTMEWRLVSGVYDNTDPDGEVGPAKASASFTLQVHTISGTANNINTISTGWSYQAANHMIPTGSSGPGCPATVSNPANVVVSASLGLSWRFNSVNQCGLVAQLAGGKDFENRAVGTLEGDPISITTAWQDLFTVTLWEIGVANEGYVIINSGEGGSPGTFTTYAVSDDIGTTFPVNSLTYSTPLRLGSPLPVGLGNFDITCTGNGAKLNWQTLTEQNSKNFEIEKSTNGATGWSSLGSTLAAGLSATTKNYEYFDLRSGSAYYRLKQVDKDGRYTYSQVQKANCLTKTNAVLVYPVPAKNILNVVLGAERSGKATLVLVDISGSVVKQHPIELLKGTNNFKLNISGLSAGEYLVKVIGSEAFKTQKVSIIK